jgi:hypothetical protein
MASQDQTAVIYLRQLITVNFPEVALHWAAAQNVDPSNRNAPRFRETHSLHGVGGYKNRTTEFGNPSLHASGRAADIYVKTANPLLKAIGDQLFKGFTTQGPLIGLEEVIWNRQIWSRSHPTIQQYQGSKTHEDHVHVGFTRAGSQQRSPLLATIVQQAKAAVDALYP